MSLKLSPQDKRWLEEHSHEIPGEIEGHPQVVEPGQNEEIHFREREPPRVYGQRVVTVPFSELSVETDEGETQPFEESIEQDFVEGYKSFLGRDEWDEWTTNWLWEEDPSYVYEELNGDDDELYFCGQNHRMWKVRLEYFMAKGDHAAVKVCQDQLNLIRRDIHNLKNDLYSTGEHRLTLRQREILDLLRAGVAQVEISRKLGISRAAVSKTLKRIKELTGGRATMNILGADPNPTGTGVIGLQRCTQPRRCKKRSGCANELRGTG